jgi:alcohol dehydrogenase (cytochrome c)
MSARAKLLATTVLLVGAVACSTRKPVRPLTERAVPFNSLDPDRRGTAPDVARSLDATRIAAARREPQNWLTYYGAYDGQRYSALEQITTANVGRLRPAWVFQYSEPGLKAAPLTAAFEAAPIVIDGVMYVTGPNGYLWALDATTGTQLWTYQHAIPIDVPLCCGNVNRGAAVARGKVFFTAANGVLVALDAVTGTPVWTRTFADVRAGESATAAPLIVKQLVIVGSSGAEFGVRGHLDAFDLETGRPVWRRYMVPKPGEPGSESWPRSDAWARGGGATWITGTYDPALDLLYWGTANPAPVFYGADREGSNLYTSSVVALDPDDGAIRWHYQYTPHDVWDYDGVGENILFEQDGRPLLAHFDRNGYLFILDRRTGAFVRATRFARADWADIDASTGQLSNRREPTERGQRICPGPAGAKVWNHAAWHPGAQLLIVPVIELCATFKAAKEPFREGLPIFGSTFVNTQEDGWGEVKAVDPRTGRVAWSWRATAPIVTSMLATAGNLVFTGEPNGEVRAFDVRTGAAVWRFRTGGGIHSNPITYAVNGRQYVAVPVGWGGWLEGFAPKGYGIPRGNALYVFALDGGASPAATTSPP